MGDEQAGAAGSAVDQDLGDTGLRHRVEAGEGVVEDEQAAAVGERPGETEPLGLPAGARGVGDEGVVTVGQPAHEVVRVGRAGGLPDTGGGGGPEGEADLLLDGAAEQSGAFEGVPDRAAQFVVGELAQRHPVEQDLPGVRFGEPPGDRGEQ